MNKYSYLGYYNDNADIKGIIQDKGWNDPNKVQSYLEDGYGKFYSGSSDDEECMTISDVDNKTVFVTNDGKYIVKFSEGRYVALDEDDHTSINASFFIDIWKAEEVDEESSFSDTALFRLSEKRSQENRRIKSVIKDEFKAVFKKTGEGLDLYSNANTYVYGMLDATGCIGKMFLNGDGKIQVLLVQEYDDLEEDFENRYFACDDWPMLLLLVRQGIREEWYINDEEEYEDN